MADHTEDLLSHGTLLFIPAYNCEAQIPRVIDQIDADVREVIDEVVVIENRSTDGTLEAARSGLEKLPAGIKRTLIQNTENYSLGGSIKHAILYGLENGYENLIVLHGDDQADVRDMLPAFRDGLVASNDLVVGARFHKDSHLQGYSWFRIFGNRVLGGVFGAVVRRRIDDLIAGLNVFKLEFFENREFLNYPNNLTFDAHVLLDACDRKSRITFVPITWREEDQVSNAKTIKQGWTILKLVLAYGVRRRAALEGNKSGRPAGFEYPGEIVYTADAESEQR